MNEKEKKDIEKKEITICPFCLIELKAKTDWQKFFLIISGLDDLELNDLLLLTDKANEILLKEVTRRTGIQNYEPAATQQPPQHPHRLQQPPQQPFPPPMIHEGQVAGQDPLQGIPHVKQMFEIIQQKWVNKQCPFCQQQNWIVNEQIFQLSQWQQGAIIVGPGVKVQPVISIICRNCGYTTISNAIINGIVKTQPPPSKPPA